jgi:hypothetical protein
VVDDFSKFSTIHTKSDTVHTKIGTAHPKFGIKIGFGHVRFSHPAKFLNTGAKYYGGRTFLQNIFSRTPFLSIADRFFPSFRTDEWASCPSHQSVGVCDNKFVQGWSRDRGNDDNIKGTKIFRQVQRFFRG